VNSLDVSAPASVGERMNTSSPRINLISLGVPNHFPAVCWR
jgi:hypothetical protein